MLYNVYTGINHDPGMTLGVLVEWEISKMPFTPPSDRKSPKLSLHNGSMLIPSHTGC